MVDVHSKEVRSFNMSQIRGKNTKPELAVRSYLHRRGLRFRLHKKDLPGKPDLVFRQFDTVLFVHGCYWHRHRGCKYATTPDKDREKWLKKFSRNTVLDAQHTERLQIKGWRVLVIWECETRDEEYLSQLSQEIRNG